MSPFEKVKTEIIPQCIKCHKGIDNEEKLATWINPSEPEKSLLFEVIENGSMPMGGEPLSTEKLELVHEYILSLKPHESGISFAEIKAKIIEPHACLNATRPWEMRQPL